MNTPSVLSPRKFRELVAPELELSTIQNYMSSGELPIIKYGKKTYINMLAFERECEKKYAQDVKIRDEFTGLK